MFELERELENPTIEVYGVELEFDVLNEETAQRLEEALAKVKLRTQKYSSKNKKLSKIINEQCEFVFDFFDEVFGEGTHNKIFGETKNLGHCLEAFRIVVSEIDAKSKEVSKGSFLDLN
jgi:hypothetical protein